MHVHVKMVSLKKEKLTDCEDYTPTETDENRLTTKCFRKCACDSRCGLHTPSRAGWTCTLGRETPQYFLSLVHFQCVSSCHALSSHHDVVHHFSDVFPACGFPQQAGRLLIDGTIEWNSNLLYVDRLRSKLPKICDNQMSQLRFRGSKSSRALLLFNISCGFTPAS